MPPNDARFRLDPPQGTAPQQSAVDELGDRGVICDHAQMSGKADALERAIGLAWRAHHGQRYPSPEAEPYILHVLRVMLAMRGFESQMVAVLHDVLEDTAVTVDELRAAEIPDSVVEAVLVLTRTRGQSYEDYVERVADDDLARRVKLADLTDNLASNQRLATNSEVAARIARYEKAIERLQASPPTTETGECDVIEL